jgi:hypothetical protein
MKRSPLRKKSNSPVAECKDRIQALLRAIAIIRDGGCVLRSPAIQREYGIKDCSGWRKDDDVVLQYDHLNSRAFNVRIAAPSWPRNTERKHHLDTRGLLQYACGQLRLKLGIPI